jgi:hypothetical protein
LNTARYQDGAAVQRISAKHPYQFGDTSPMTSSSNFDVRKPQHPKGGRSGSGVHTGLVLEHPQDEEHDERRNRDQKIERERDG